jgi:hypothetical protein
VQLAKLYKANAAHTAHVAWDFPRLDAMGNILSVLFRHYGRGTSTYQIMPVLLSKDKKAV